MTSSLYTVPILPCTVCRLRRKARIDIMSLFTSSQVRPSSNSRAQVDDGEQVSQQRLVSSVEGVLYRCLEILGLPQLVHNLQSPRSSRDDRHHGGVATHDAIDDLLL
ncbi:hypothetical protein E2C01_004486 [Portunus trituberculatus]|uniref:Uncharacterized protein n=1 Tax=Portunus trituberculatus TaxID=210409 RepID=A0A5B7CQT6_PORTR|nr:hypothetical protein [Portunus trituberculatus]